MTVEERQELVAFLKSLRPPGAAEWTRRRQLSRLDRTAIRAGL